MQPLTTGQATSISEPLCTDVVGLELAPILLADVVALVLPTLTPGFWQVVRQFPFAVSQHLL